MIFLPPGGASGPCRFKTSCFGWTAATSSPWTGSNHIGNLGVTGRIRLQEAGMVATLHFSRGAIWLLLRSFEPEHPNCAINMHYHWSARANCGHFSEKDLCASRTTSLLYLLMMWPATPIWVLLLNDNSLLFTANASQMLLKRAARETCSTEDNVALERSADIRTCTLTSWRRPWKWTSTASMSARSGRTNCTGHRREGRCWFAVESRPSLARSEVGGECWRCLTNWAHAHKALVTSKSLQVFGPRSTTWMRAANKSCGNTCKGK